MPHYTDDPDAAAHAAGYEALGARIPNLAARLHLLAAGLLPPAQAQRTAVVHLPGFLSAEEVSSLKAAVGRAQAR